MGIFGILSIGRFVERLTIEVLASYISCYIDSLKDHRGKFTCKSSIVVLVGANLLPSP